MVSIAGTKNTIHRRIPQPRGNMKDEVNQILLCNFAISTIQSHPTTLCEFEYGKLVHEQCETFRRKSIDH